MEISQIKEAEAREREAFPEFTAWKEGPKPSRLAEIECLSGRLEGAAQALKVTGRDGFKNAEAQRFYQLSQYTRFIEAAEKLLQIAQSPLTPSSEIEEAQKALILVWHKKPRKSASAS